MPALKSAIEQLSQSGELGPLKTHHELLGLPAPTAEQLKGARKGRAMQAVPGSQQQQQQQQQQQYPQQQYQ